MLPRTCLGLLAAGSILFSSALSAAHPVTVDGNPGEWLGRTPNAANLGLIARDAMGHGEYVWRDALGDTRTDIATPEVVADIAAFQVTGSPTGLAFLLRRQAGVAFTGAPIQVQIAIDMDRVDKSGQDFFAAFADTKVADGARWERLVQTLFGSGGKAQVIDTAFNKVADADAAVGAGGDVEIFVPWSALGLNGPPATPLRFTVATFRAQSNDLTVDIGGAGSSNALDCVSDYGDPAAANYPNAYNELQDQVVDYHFDLWFDAQGEVFAPLVVQRFLSNASGGGSDEWYAVRNTTAMPLALDNFKIGDEETPDGNEGMFAFPAGATLAAGATYVVARSGSAYQAFFGKAPDAELPPGATMAVPDMTAFLPWTNGVAGTMLLTNSGDELLVLDPSNTILDLAVFGNGAYAGVDALSPAPGTDEVATRTDTSSDTDDCNVDFKNAGKTCTADAQCGGACLQCANNACTPKPMGAACPDANPCNGDEICDGKGACVASTAPPCDDNNPCTADACTPATGCTHTPVTAGTACSDGNVCNGDEVCDANGTCQAGVPLDCDDGNACTFDACDPAKGCTNDSMPDGTSCSDGDQCNGGEACLAGVCTAGAALDCDDGNECTVDSCDAATGCAHANAIDGAPCGDASCNGACVVGSCQCGVGGGGVGGGAGTSSSGSGGAGTSSSSSSSGSVTTSSGSATTSSGTGGGGSGIQDSGCGCRVAGDGEGDAAAATWLLAIAAAGAISRRRRVQR